MSLLLPAKEVAGRYVFSPVCLSVCLRGGGSHVTTLPPPTPHSTPGLFKLVHLGKLVVGLRLKGHLVYNCFCSLGRRNKFTRADSGKCKSYTIYTYRCTLQKMLSRFVLPYRCKVGKIKATLEAYVKEKHFESVFQVNRKIKLQYKWISY